MAAREDQEMPLVIVIRPPSFNLSLNDRLSPYFRILDPTSSSEPISSFLSGHAQSARALVCVGYATISSETIGLLPSLELVVATSAGVDKIDLQECRRRGITVTNASVAFAVEVADYAVALLFDVLRRISAADRYVRAGSWPVKGDYPLGFKIGGKRVGIVGLGSIGSAVAKRLIAFDCSIAYTSREQKPFVAFPFYTNVRDLAINSDVLILCCSLTKETRHMINKDVMTALGKDGVIINIGRGSLINEQELVEFLVQGRIGGAGLDVFEDEPNVPRELFPLDNVVLSPHLAVGTPEAIQGVIDLAVTNLKAFFSNEPLQSLVHLD